jgi:hypothetical protein
MRDFVFDSGAYLEENGHEFVNVKAHFSRTGGNSEKSWIVIRAPEQPLRVEVPIDAYTIDVIEETAQQVGICITGEWELDSFINGLRNLIESYDMKCKLDRGNHD